MNNYLGIYFELKMIVLHQMILKDSLCKSLCYGESLR